MAWVFEDLFNSDTKSTGDLNGQDGWASDTNFDVVTTSPDEGNQCVLAVPSATHYIDKTITSVSSGILYVSLKGGSVVTQNTQLSLYDGATQVLLLQLKNGDIKYNDGASYLVAQSYSANTWYRIGIDFDASTDTYKYNINGGAWSSSKDFFNAITDLDVIRLWESSGAENSYFDAISPDYTPSSPASSFLPQIIMS